MLVIDGGYTQHLCSPVIQASVFSSSLPFRLLNHSVNTNEILSFQTKQSLFVIEVFTSGKATSVFEAAEGESHKHVFVYSIV